MSERGGSSLSDQQQPIPPSGPIDAADLLAGTKSLSSSELQHNARGQTLQDVGAQPVVSPSQPCENQDGNRSVPAASSDTGLPPFLPSIAAPNTATASTGPARDPHHSTPAQMPEPDDSDPEPPVSRARPSAPAPSIGEYERLEADRKTGSVKLDRGKVDSVDLRAGSSDIASDLPLDQPATPQVETAPYIGASRGRDDLSQDMSESDPTPGHEPTSVGPASDNRLPAAPAVSQEVAGCSMGPTASTATETMGDGSDKQESGMADTTESREQTTMDDWTFELHAVQSPTHGQALEQDPLRRATPRLSPPFVFKLQAKDGGGMVLHHGEPRLARRLTHLVIVVELVSPNSTESRSLYRRPVPARFVQPNLQRRLPSEALLGTRARTPQVMLLPDDTVKSHVFIFDDLVVRPLGRHALRAVLMDVAKWVSYLDSEDQLTKTPFGSKPNVNQYRAPSVRGGLAQLRH